MEWRVGFEVPGRVAVHEVFLLDGIQRNMPSLERTFNGFSVIGIRLRVPIPTHRHHRTDGARLCHIFEQDKR